MVLLTFIFLAPCLAHSGHPLKSCRKKKRKRRKRRKRKKEKEKEKEEEEEKEKEKEKESCLLYTSDAADD